LWANVVDYKQDEGQAYGLDSAFCFSPEYLFIVHSTRKRMEQLSHVSLASVLLATLVSGQATQIVSSVSSSAPQVDLGYVKYQGYENSTAGIKYFRGLQYATDNTLKFPS